MTGESPESGRSTLRRRRVPKLVGGSSNGGQPSDPGAPCFGARPVANTGSAPTGWSSLDCAVPVAQHRWGHASRRRARQRRLHYLAQTRNGVESILCQPYHNGRTEVSRRQQVNALRCEKAGTSALVSLVPQCSRYSAGWPDARGIPVEPIDRHDSPGAMIWRTHVHET